MEKFGFRSNVQKMEIQDEEMSQLQGNAHVLGSPTEKLREEIYERIVKLEDAQAASLGVFEKRIGCLEQNSPVLQKYFGIIFEAISRFKKENAELQEILRLEREPKNSEHMWQKWVQFGHHL